MAEGEQGCGDTRRLAVVHFNRGMNLKGRLLEILLTGKGAENVNGQGKCGQIKARIHQSCGGRHWSIGFVEHWS